MSIFQAVILGIIQGFSEFLPISSSGHLVLFQNIFKIEENPMTFDIILHLGTLVPVIIVFWEDIWALLKKPFQKMTMLILVGTIPAVIVALLCGDFIESFFDTNKPGGGLYLGIGFFITGVLLIYADSVSRGKKDTSDITYTDSLIVGIMQGLAIMPAISRSGSTIAGSLGRKLNRETAAKFSFLLSIPAILGAAVLQLKDVVMGNQPEGLSVGISATLFGFIAAMLSGYLSIKFMMSLIKSCKLKYFSYYVFILAGFILLDQIVLHVIFK